MKTFIECLKDAGRESVHVPSSFGSQNFRFGRGRSQPQRNKKQRAAAGTMASLQAPSADLGDDDSDNIIGKTWNLPLEIKKTDPDKQLIFGWASIVMKDGAPIVDKQEHIIPVSELENAVYEYVVSSRDHGDMHAKRYKASLVESMVFTLEKQKALNIVIKNDAGEHIVGWWTGFKVSDPELWAAHKRGERPEFSIGGAARQDDA